MYDLKNVADDFPWTRVGETCPVEPWREPGSNWFDRLPPGWGDVIHEGLEKMDAFLEERDAKDGFSFAQVKEKFGLLRMYFDADLTDDDYRALDDLVDEIEDETGRVCCFCGARDDLHRHGPWIHYSCAACEPPEEEEPRG